MKDEICTNETNPEVIIEKLASLLISDNIAYDLSEFFKIFGDKTRIKILQLLSIQETCVHEIAACLKMQQSAVSHQLKILKQYKLVKVRKEGKHVFYSLNDNHIMQIFNNGVDHINE
ncbi:MAG: metalloregulator ArsR/SmtB family transcription factor [Bacilli bacterium]|jgi:DNA-binding transcriptional ArsR family regulator|nr:metalloregulator ArsR/SmtB family transcription factor [Bacilli bacterium]